MKNGKSAGVDELVVEMIKYGGPIAMHWLYRVIRVVWKEKKIPRDCGRKELLYRFTRKVTERSVETTEG